MQIRKGYGAATRYSLNIAYYNGHYATIMIVTPVCRGRKTNVSNCSFLVRTRKATAMTNDDVVCRVHSSPRQSPRRGDFFLRVSLSLEIYMSDSSRDAGDAERRYH